jgi:hypothetical protein
MTSDEAFARLQRFALWYRNAGWFKRYMVRGMIVFAIIVPAERATYGQIVTHHWHHLALSMSGGYYFNYPCRSLLDGDIQYRYQYASFDGNGLVWSDWTPDNEGIMPDGSFGPQYCK